MSRTSQFRSIRAVLAGVACAAVLAVGVVAAPAQAAPSIPTLPGVVALPAGASGAAQCPSGKMCFWDGPNFTGNGWFSDKPRFTFQCPTALYRGFNPPRSMGNHTNGNIALYRVGGCFGAFQIGVLEPGTGFTDVSPYRVYGWNWTL